MSSTLSEGYPPQSSQIQQQVSQTGHASALPFTGYDAGLFAGGGLVLVIVAVVLRRAVRP